MEENSDDKHIDHISSETPYKRQKVVEETKLNSNMFSDLQEQKSM